MFDEFQISSSADIMRIQRLKSALRSIVNMLGPDQVACESNDCQGCKMEMAEALRIAKEALGEKLD